MDENVLLENLKNAAIEAGDILLSAEDRRKEITEKSGTANFVTEYDVKVQHFLEERLANVFPEAGFIGEEEDAVHHSEREYVFVVDPIDGTTNFIKNYRMSCVSIGLLKDKKPYMSVIYNPYLKELFWAKKGCGAYCNEQPIHVSERGLSESIVLVGTAPYDRSLADITFRQMRIFFDVTLDVRRSGSAALDLCAIASGRAEIFWEWTLKPWDFAAGALLITEAGGRITKPNGEELDYLCPCSVLACGSVYSEAQEKILSV